jgi:hypothetical protein
LRQICIVLLFASRFLIAQETRAREVPDTGGPGNLPTAAEINSVLKELSEITGFRIRKQLPFAMITRDQVNKYLKDQIKRNVKPDEIRAEEVTLKKFGFVPPDFDLKKNTIELLTEQAAAFYDFHQKKLFISDWAAQNMRQAALVHELGHALADQNFSIEKFLGGKNDDSEDSAAREAVVEGQASWLMLEFAARRIGKSLKDPEVAREFMKSDEPDSAGDKDYPVFANAPLYIRRTLMFPYEEGEQFQQAVFLHDGESSFSELFRTPPTTTAQVMHPDLYFAHVAETRPQLPKPAPHTKAFVTGSVGELDEQILLEQYINKETAESLAPKLKGGAYRIDETKADHRMTLIYASEWADDAAASAYFDAYQKVLRSKWKHVEILAQDDSHFAGKSEDGFFVVRRTGNLVLSKEGYASALE